jgi:hypothetical protein
MNARELFKSNEAVVEYRPVKRTDGSWDWFWVLLPLPAEDVALGSGLEASRGTASLEARKEARRVGRRIAKVRVHHHKLKESQLISEAHDPFGPNWRPTRDMLAWFQRFLSMMNDKSTWAVPGTGQVYKIDRKAKTFTLIDGPLHEPMHWHEKNKVTLGMLGYKVLDKPAPPPNPNEIALAEAEEEVPAPPEEGDEEFDPRAYTVDGSATEFVLGLLKHDDDWIEHTKTAKHTCVWRVIYNPNYKIGVYIFAYALDEEDAVYFQVTSGKGSVAKGSVPVDTAYALVADLGYTIKKCDSWERMVSGVGEAFRRWDANPDVTVFESEEEGDEEFNPREFTVSNNSEELILNDPITEWGPLFEPLGFVYKDTKMFHFPRWKRWQKKTRVGEWSVSQSEKRGFVRVISDIEVVDYQRQRKMKSASQRVEKDISIGYVMPYLKKNGALTDDIANSYLDPDVEQDTVGQDNPYGNSIIGDEGIAGQYDHTYLEPDERGPYQDTEHDPEYDDNPDYFRDSDAERYPDQDESVAARVVNRLLS